MDVRGIIKPDILFEFGYSEAEYLPYLLPIRVSDRIPSDPATWGWMQWFGLAKPSDINKRGRTYMARKRGETR